jgi:hypothetical protein
LLSFAEVLILSNDIVVAVFPKGAIHFLDGREAIFHLEEINYLYIEI